MRRDKGRILAISLLLLLMGGLLAAAGPTCASKRKTDEELLRTATHDLVHKLRAAAASALADRLGGQIAKDEPIPLDYLEGLARSFTPELRKEIVAPLVVAYWRALERGELTIDELVSGIYTGESHELCAARALAAMWFLFATRTLQLPSIEDFFGKYVAFPWAPNPWEAELHLERDVALDLLQRLEDLMRGGEEELWGYHFDGSVEVVRQNAFDLAWITLFIIDKEVLYQLHSCEEWFNLAGMGETEELRSFTSWIYFLGTDCAPDDPTMLLDLAIDGESHELRLGAALRYIFWYISSEETSAEVTDGETLIDLALYGGSEELRDAAATGLPTLWEGELAPITLRELYDLALDGGTPQLRHAAGEALEAMWEKALREGSLRGCLKRV